LSAENSPLDEIQLKIASWYEAAWETGVMKEGLVESLQRSVQVTLASLLRQGDTSAASRLSLGHFPFGTLREMTSLSGRARPIGGLHTQRFCIERHNEVG